MIQSQARRLYLVEKNEKRPSVSSHGTDENVVPANKSQMRKRFDLGGQSSAVTSPNVTPVQNRRGSPEGATRDVTPNNRKTTRPAAPDAEPASKRPTIPTPRPRLSLGAIARRIVDNHAMMKLPLDHRAAFVLTHLDGKTNLRTLIDVTGMVPDELVTIVERLLELHAIVMV